MWPQWNQVEFFLSRLDFVLQTLMALTKDFNHLVPTLFWARPKSEFGEYLATQASNNVMKKYWFRGLFLGSKLLGSFLMSAIYSFLKYYATDRQAVATLKIYNSGFVRLCATHILNLLHPSLDFDPYFGSHWARSTNQPLCYAAATSRPIVWLIAEPW